MVNYSLNTLTFLRSSCTGKLAVKIYTPEGKVKGISEVFRQITNDGKCYDCVYNGYVNDIPLSLINILEETTIKEIKIINGNELGIFIKIKFIYPYFDL